jgi:anti-anti-sigma factor
MAEKKRGLLHMTYAFESVNGQAALVVTADMAELVEVKSCQLFSIILETLLEEPQAMVVDLKQVKIISSLGLGAIINAVQKAEAAGRKLYFRVSPEVQETLAVTSFDHKVNLL